MSDNKPEAETTETEKRVEIKNLPRSPQELTEVEEKEVKGGAFVGSTLTDIANQDRFPDAESSRGDDTATKELP